MCVLSPTSGSSSRSAREGSGCGHWCCVHVSAACLGSGLQATYVCVYTHTHRDRARIHHKSTYVCIYGVSVCSYKEPCSASPLAAAGAQSCSSRPALGLPDPARCFFFPCHPALAPFSLLLSLPTTPGISVLAPLPAWGSPIPPGCSRERGWGADSAGVARSGSAGTRHGWGWLRSPGILWSQPGWAVSAMSLRWL